ncbi:uncharacterized protein HD556DRAFT_677410 [Suillus plorans]|uniref:Uncharacterized protein n=1 Tax=Suillus plorans TaxID=116603 RepID=A0A9P7AJJ0_9AGAM|nr:uncharacterized protein HD556DRAFT_677410 [Suillus plorans]KAG1790776.1 hypothetical protein HD556DRAFT_677410 [Suillus plorans]
MVSGVGSHLAGVFCACQWLLLKCIFSLGYISACSSTTLKSAFLLSVVSRVCADLHRFTVVVSVVYKHGSVGLTNRGLVPFMNQRMCRPAFVRSNYVGENVTFGSVLRTVEEKGMVQQRSHRERRGGWYE